MKIFRKLSILLKVKLGHSIKSDGYCEPPVDFIIDNSIDLYQDAKPLSVENYSVFLDDTLEKKSKNEK